MNDDLEDQLFEATFEYKGQENYTPTRSFLKKVYAILTFQISIALFIHILFGKSLNSIIFKLLTFSFINFWTILFTLISLSAFQIYFARFYERHQKAYLIAFILRTFLLYFILRLLVRPGYYKEITLFIGLVLSLHVVFLCLAYRMKGTFEPKIAVFWMIIWSLLMLFIVEPVFIKNSIDGLGMFVCVVMVFLYGLYLIFETEFILNGRVFGTDYHEVMLAAFMVQFDLTGALLWWTEERLGIRINDVNV